MILFKQRVKYLFVPVVAVFCLVLFGPVQTGFTGSASEEADWSEDLENKINKTMKVLDVVKKEIKDYREREEAKSAPAQLGAVTDEEESLADMLRGKLSRAIRIWRKLKEAVQEEAEKAKQGKGTQEPDWAKDLSKKLDKTIEAMTVIKEELEEVEKSGQ
ncbi:MAG: hypothetical protein ACE5JK_03760 [Candidatus Omnitrophota bacterium]